ncbi:MAG TPA: 23S rRNA (pseudouridine(1915)-N(3))-methyltransferase RlmH [Ruminococcaceae bacterium]|nr:23S rRNA (pseudouridine(1915)-N(3))-methyltransferase RlmH [Oscillospiraceae bacterium]
MKVTVVCLGKLKEKYLRDACDEYGKRLGAFCRFEVAELAPVKLPDNPSPAQIQAALTQEATLIKAKIPKGAAVFALCIEGKTVSSEAFSELMEKAAVRGGSDVVFLIGSSFGLDEELKKTAHYRLSMSPMTFPHQLARVMLLEQIYRAFQIANGGKYHK